MYRGSFTQYPDTAVFECIDVGYLSVHARVIAVCARAGDRRITAVVWYTAVRVRSQRQLPTAVMFGSHRCQGKCRGDAPDEWDWSQPRGRISLISGERFIGPCEKPETGVLPTDGFGRILDSAGLPFQIPRPPPFVDGWGETREEHDERARRCVLLCTPAYPYVPSPAVYQQVDGCGVYAAVVPVGVPETLAAAVGTPDYGVDRSGNSKGHNGHVLIVSPESEVIGLDGMSQDQIVRLRDVIDCQVGARSEDTERKAVVEAVGRAPVGVPETLAAATTAARSALDEAVVALTAATAAARCALAAVAAAELAEANPYCVPYAERHSVIPPECWAGSTQYPSSSLAGDWRNGGL